MRRSQALFLALLLLGSSPASAKLTYQNRVIIEGAVDCGRWVTARKHDGANIFEDYVLGFLNGLSIGQDEEFWYAGNAPISRDAVFLWLDKYCDMNPLNLMTQGIIELFKQRTETPIR